MTKTKLKNPVKTNTGTNKSAHVLLAICVYLYCSLELYSADELVLVRSFHLCQSTLNDVHDP